MYFLTHINKPKNHYYPLFILYFSVFITTYGYSQISFAPYKSYRTGSFPEVVCIGDVNNDGLNDVVLGTSFYFDINNDYKIFVYLQDTIGNLLQPVKYSYSPQLRYNIAMSIADVNNDSLNDVIIGCNDSIGIYYQNSYGMLSPIQYYYSGNNYDSIDDISAGDLNNDGLTDIVVSHGIASFISVLYQTISGGFTFKYYPAPIGDLVPQIEVADVNNDELHDVVFMAGKFQMGVRVYLQNASGTLNNYVTYFAPDFFSLLMGIDVGDLNNDGINDIAESIYGNNTESEIAILFQEPTTGLMQEPAFQITGYGASGPIKIADLNCDNRNEIVVANFAMSELSVFEQDFANKYNSYSLFPIPWKSAYLLDGLDIEDINNDGKKDVVIVDYEKGLVVLLNQSNPSKPMRPFGDSLICTNEFKTVYKTHSILNTTLTWNLFPPQAGTIISSNRDSCQVLWNDAWQGTSELFVTATNKCGYSNSEILYIASSRLPSINLGNDTILCENSTMEIFADTGFANYMWQDNSTGSTFTLDKGGIYFVHAEHECGTSYDTIIITQVILPEIELNDTILCSGNVIQLNITKPGLTSYLWQDNSKSPNYTISNVGTYTIRVTDTNNCQNSKSFNVEYCPDYLDVPSAFSPNGDGINDILYAVGTNVEHINFVIYNRWGQVVFESDDLSKGWDGTFEGKQLNTAVFVYTISATSTTTGAAIQKSGNISLIR